MKNALLVVYLDVQYLEDQMRRKFINKKIKSFRLNLSGGLITNLEELSHRDGPVHKSPKPV